jgi:1-acyl-sn-glycerol-3-phosphate acyltransferase
METFPMQKPNHSASTLLATGRIFVFLFALAIIFLPVCGLSSVLSFGQFAKVKRVKESLIQGFYRLMGKVWGVRLAVRGALPTTRPLLVVSNHCSYLDIVILGQLMPLAFTPKAEIASWPIIGTLCRLAGCIFIDRRRESTEKNRQRLHVALQEEGTMVSIFPESTTNDGLQMQPFHSAFFSLAEIRLLTGEYLPVQPVSIAYHHADGTTLSRAEMDAVAWYGDAEFVPHLWEYLQTTGVWVTVTFHPPVTLEPFANRKALAEACETQVRSAFFVE